MFSLKGDNMREIMAIVAVATIAASVASAQIPSNGLIAYYPFSGNANDESGSGRNGIVYGATLTTDRFGNGNSAYSFDGASSYVSAGTQSFQLPLSVSIWFYSPSINSVWRTLIEWQNMMTPGLQIYAVGNGSIGVRLGVWQNSLNPLLDSNDLKSTAKVDGTSSWHMITVTKDTAEQAVNFNLYIDGVLDVSKLDTNSIGNNHTLLFGEEHTGNAQYHFMGKLDDITIYDRVLSAQEISSLYTGTTTIVNPGPQLIPVASPSTNVRPLLTWHPLSNQTPYTVQIDTTTSFAAPLITIAVSDTFFSPLVNLPAGTIYWRVKGDSTAYSTTGSFVITDVRIPLLIPYEPKITQVRRPLLQWHPVAGASQYTVEADVTLSFSAPVFSLAVSDTFFQVLSDLPFGNICWKVKSNLVNTWSAVDQFVILPDSIPNLVRFNGSTVSTSRPAFVWHPVSGAAGYKIEVADNTAFTGATSLLVADTTFSPLANLSDGTWYWHVSCSRNYALFAPADTVRIAAVGIEIHTATAVKPFVHFAKSSLGVLISFGGYDRGKVNATVYSVSGEVVARLKGPDSGNNLMVWSYTDRWGKRVSNGLYVLYVNAGPRSIKQKLFVTN
jgi:Concanavalin A-like lectin/glucanases superfamily